MYEYVIRWKDDDGATVELTHEDGLVRELRPVMLCAEGICSALSTDVVVIENGTLVCIVRPD